MTEWLTNNWEVICVVLVVLINVINAATRHFKEHKGFAKAMLFISEVLSIVVSKGRTTTKGGTLKPPFTSAEKKEEDLNEK